MPIWGSQRPARIRQVEPGRTGRPVVAFRLRFSRTNAIKEMGGGSPPPEEKDVWVATLARSCPSTPTYVPARKWFNAPSRSPFYGPISTNTARRDGKAAQDRCRPWLFP
jgi:hypothetical protein